MTLDKNTAQRSMAWVLAVLIAAVPFAIFQLPSPATAVDSGQSYVAVQNVRLVNTSSGLGGSSAPFSSGETRSYHVGGANGLPSTGITSVSLSVGVVGTTSSSEGNVIVFRAGSTRPDTSNVRYNTQTVPESNTALVALSSNGDFSVYVTRGATDVIIDLQGYTTGTSTSGTGDLRAVNPVRAVDTRAGLGAAAAKVPAGGSIDVTLAGVGDVPVGARSVFVNVIVLSATDHGYVKAYPPSLSPGASTPFARYAVGVTGSTAGFAELSADGKLRIYNYLYGSPVHVVIDIQGFAGSPASGASFNPSSGRSYDSRPNRIAAGAVQTVQISGTGGLPTDGIAAAALNLTVWEPSADGYLRAWDASKIEPSTSVVNFESGSAFSNVAIVGLSTDGKIKIKNRGSGAIDVLIDVQGWFATPEAIGNADGSSALADPPAPAMYANGLDAYDMQDLQVRADVEGITLSQAVDRYAWQDKFEEAVGNASASYPNQFADAEIIDGAQPTAEVKFSDGIPSGAAPMFASVPAAVSITGDAEYSKLEIDDMAAAALDGIVNEVGAESQVVVIPEGTSGNFEAAVYVPEADAESSSTGAAAAMTAAAAEQEMATQSSSNGPANVNVTFLETPRAELNSLRGGVRIGNTSTRSSCTSGFPARKVTGTSTSIYGLLTADHCPDSLPTYSYLQSEPRTRLYNADTFLPFRQGDAQFHQTFGENIGNSFYANVGEVRRLTGVRAPVKGKRYCMFGRRSLGGTPSNPTCATVKKLGANVHYSTPNRNYSGLTLMKTEVGQRGDSGGPWFKGGKAIGLVSGHVPCGAFWRSTCDTFTPIAGNQYVSGFNVGVVGPGS